MGGGGGGRRGGRNVPFILSKIVVIRRFSLHKLTSCKSAGTNSDPSRAKRILNQHLFFFTEERIIETNIKVNIAIIKWRQLFAAYIKRRMSYCSWYASSFDGNHYFVWFSLPRSWTLGTFSKPRRQRKRECCKTKDLIRRIMALHVHNKTWYIS